MLFLSDIQPTDYFTADLANVKPGEDVAVFGVGHVSYFAVMGSILGVTWAFSINHLPQAWTRQKTIVQRPLTLTTRTQLTYKERDWQQERVACIDAVGFEAAVHVAGNVSIRDDTNLSISDGGGGDATTADAAAGHDNSKVDIPAYQPTKPNAGNNMLCHSQKKTLDCPYRCYGSA